MTILIAVSVYLVLYPIFLDCTNSAVLCHQQSGYIQDAQQSNAEQSGANKGATKWFGIIPVSYLYAPQME